jgi:hypothetical protein
MRYFQIIALIALVNLSLGGCLASTSSSDGISCDYSKGKPTWDLPLVCQPNGG